MPGYKNQDWVSRKLKCMQVKQSGVISSSINCSPEPRLAGRCGCACDRRKQGTVHLTASWGFITGVVLRGSLGPSAEQQASHTPSPQTAENMPGKGEKLPRVDGGSQPKAAPPNTSRFSSPPGAASLPLSGLRSQPCTARPNPCRSPPPSWLPPAEAQLPLDNEH